MLQPRVYIIPDLEEITQNYVTVDAHIRALMLNLTAPSLQETIKAAENRPTER